MKRLSIYIFVILAILFLNACNYETKNSGEAKSSEIKPLLMEDFTVTDGINSIVLDSLFDEFKTDEIEIKHDNNYVGEIYAGDFTYKVFFHEYANFDLYTSNTNYNLKNRNFDEYHITQITLKSQKYKTNRGLTVGSDIEEIYELYGPGEVKDRDDKTELCYTMNDMELSFIIGNDKKVETNILTVFPVEGE